MKHKMKKPKKPKMMKKKSRSDKSSFCLSLLLDLHLPSTQLRPQNVRQTKGQQDNLNWSSAKDMIEKQ